MEQAFVKMLLFPGATAPLSWMVSCVRGGGLHRSGLQLTSSFADQRISSSSLADLVVNFASFSAGLVEADTQIKK